MEGVTTCQDPCIRYVCGVQSTCRTIQAKLVAQPGQLVPRAGLGRWFACIYLWMTCLRGLADVSEQEPKPHAFASGLRPFLESYCFGCHGVEKAKAEVDFETLPRDTDVFKDRDLWERVRDLVEEKEMPPSKSSQPDSEERMAFLESLELEMDRLDCSQMANPGRVTVRRLNRTEYDNTIRDLLGVDFKPSEDFPLDEVGYGFDNIGDVLSLSPILLEKYLNAAESVVTNAILSELPAWPPLSRFQVETFKTESEDIIRAEGQVMGFYREGVARQLISLERSGAYEIQIRAYGQQAGPDPAKLEVRLGGWFQKVVDVKAHQDAPKVYTLNLELSAGEQMLSLAYLNNYKVQDHPVAELNGDRNLFVDDIVFKGPLNEPRPPLPISHTRVIPDQPAPGKEREHARNVLQDFVTKAWRRPVTDDALERLLQIVDQVLEEGVTYGEAIQVAVQAALTSPWFLYRWELDPVLQEGEGSRPLDAYELASRLSYFLWSSMPDERLFSLAEAGELTRPEVLRSEVKRMLDDPKSEALTRNFAGQWLQFRNLESVTPDPSLFPDFTPKLRDAMKKETELFFTTIMRENRPLTDFLEADFTFLNGPLARHYGVAGPQGDAFERVRFDATVPRGGILTQASVLTLTSNPTRTSPVLRGKWILEQILGTPPPPPPRDVPELESDQEGALRGSLRERMEQHRLKPECATCHEKMDPIGFAFEHFNAVGQWREVDGGFPIDASGELPDGTRFDGAGELVRQLKTRDTFVLCVIEKMLTFALGRGLEYYDKCTIDTIHQDLRDHNLAFQTLVESIVLSESFQQRQLEGENL